MNKPLISNAFEIHQNLRWTQYIYNSSLKFSPKYSDKKHCENLIKLIFMIEGLWRMVKQLNRVINFNIFAVNHAGLATELQANQGPRSTNRSQLSVNNYSNVGA